MINKKKNKLEKENSTDEIVLDVMRHFGFRRNYQVAKYFDVTPQTLSGWIKAGEIPPKHLIKYKDEIANLNNDRSFKIKKKSSEKEINDLNNQDIISTIKNLIKKNLKILTFIPLLSISITTIYVFVIAEKVYTSKSKVLPISEDGSTSNSFSGFASQLGINIPLSMGGKVPWDEIYPEILKSSDLLQAMLDEKYLTRKYGNLSLNQILINEHKLLKYSELDQRNRVVDKLREMIKINKDRTSPIVNIDVLAFEPMFASKLAENLILKSSLKQRQLKTNRIKQKRLFIEERLDQVSLEMKEMERILRQFRENNRNLSTSPSLQMKVQEMGREVDLQNTLYITLKTQYEKAKIDEVGRDDMVQQIDGPSIPTKLTSPKRFISISMSLIFGFLSSIFFIYVKERYIHEFK